MEALLQPWQLLLPILAGWISRWQQDAIEYLPAEYRIRREKLGKWNIPLAGKRILVNDDQRRCLAVQGKMLGRKILERPAS